MRWQVKVFIGLLIGAWMMGGCVTRGYDCRTWEPDDPELQAKREYCFPDCPSCGPAFRRPSYE